MARRSSSLTLAFFSTHPVLISYSGDRLGMVFGRICVSAFHTTVGFVRIEWWMVRFLTVGSVVVLPSTIQCVGCGGDDVAGLPPYVGGRQHLLPCAHSRQGLSLYCSYP